MKLYTKSYFFLEVSTFYLLLLRNFHDLNPLKIIFQQFPELTPLLSLHRIRPSLGESVSAAAPAHVGLFGFPAYERYSGTV